MKILELDTDRIHAELKSRGKSCTWLAEQIGCTKQALGYVLTFKLQSKASVIGDVLGITPKLLLKTVNKERYYG